ncbi:MAG: response regulator [Nostoc sp.]|uniref:response regulator n=1 Tax=Nostoc sp. TaxID=1180 RepID=UPI002FF9CE9C
MKILLVEDDVLLSTALFKLLSANHYTIDIASNGQAGLELAISAEYELILLDWLIPKLDGISLCRQLRSQGYGKSILLLTGKNSNADIVAGLDAGADDYVIKLEQQFEQQRLVMEMSQRIRRSLNFQDILQTTVDEVRQFLECDRVTIFQFYPGWGGTIVVKNLEVKIQDSESRHSLRDAGQHRLRELQEINYPILWGGRLARPSHRALMLPTPQELVGYFFCQSLTAFCN